MAVGHRDKGPETNLGDRGHQSAHILERTPAGDRIHGIPTVRRCLLMCAVRIRSRRRVTTVMSSAGSRKPVVRLGGLSAIQWVCLAVVAYYAVHVPRLVAEVRRG